MAASRVPSGQNAGTFITQHPVFLLKFPDISSLHLVQTSCYLHCIEAVCSLCMELARDHFGILKMYCRAFYCRLTRLSSIADPNHNNTFRELDFCPQAVTHNSPSVTGVDPVSNIRYLSVVLSEDEKRSGLLLCVTSGTRHEGLRQPSYCQSRSYTHTGEMQTSE